MLGDPLREALLNDAEIGVRNAAVDVLDAVWCGVAPAAARHRLIRLLRARRDGHPACDEPLHIDEYCWLMESCCKMSSLAKGDHEVVEGLVAFCKGEVEQLLPDLGVCNPTLISGASRCARYCRAWRL